MKSMILKFPDSSEKECRRCFAQQVADFSDKAIELMTFRAYCNQRLYYGLTKEAMMKQGFFGWNEEQYNEAEAIYQEMQNERS